LLIVNRIDEQIDVWSTHSLAWKSLGINQFLTNIQRNVAIYLPIWKEVGIGEGCAP